MKRFILIFLLIRFVGIGQAQNLRFPMQYESEHLNVVFAAVEQKFEVKYSYVDSIITPKIVTIPFKSYSLEELHDEIAAQTGLTIIGIDKRYYSVRQESEVLTAAEPLKEILVEGFVSKGIDKTVQKVVISPQKVDLLPGVTDADLLLSLQQLPGVKSPNETATGLYIRGGTSDQNLILWDGIRMYHPGHLFGMISGFNPNISQTVQYFTKATSAKYGERIASVISIKPTDKIADSLIVDTGINAIDADVYVRTPLVKKHLGLQVSARKSFTEWLQSPTFDALANKVFQNTNFEDFDTHNRFGFEDYSAKLNFSPNQKTSISLTGILIDNHLNFTTDESYWQTKNQKMNIRNFGYGLNWEQQYGSKWTQHSLLYYSAYRFNYLRKQQYSTNTFDAFEKWNRITDSGIETNFGYHPIENLLIEFGYQFLGNDLSHSFTARNQDLSIDLDQRQNYTVSHVGYASVKFGFEHWNFETGLRYNYFTSLHTNSVEPRFFAQRKLTSHLVWQLSYERKSQIMSQIRESQTNDLSLENYVWILADKGNYPVQKGNQFTSGIIYKANSWLFDVDAYYKTIDGVTSLSFGFLHQFDSAIHKGQGFTKGVDVLVQKSASNWRAWATYTYQDSQNKYEGLNNNNYFPINSENKHTVTVSFYKKWKRCSAAVGWFWHTGKPYSVINAENQIDNFNTERLPDYHRLDISAAYQFHCKKSWTGKAGFSLGNVYNRHTVISKEYERSYSNISNVLHSEYTVQDYYALGFTPNVFVRFSL